MNYNKSGEFIAKCRKEMNLTQEELGKKINYSRNNISKWETGQSFPDPVTLTKLAEILEVSVEEILYGEIKTDKNNQAIMENLVNEYKDKYNKFRRSNILFSVSLIVIIILSFSLIYFIFIRGTISVYKLSLDNDQFYMNNSMLLISNKKSILNFNKIEAKTEEKIEYIELYYYNEKNEKRLVFGGKDDIYFIEEDYNYREYNLNELKKEEIFIYIKTNNGEYNDLKVNMYKEYTNDNIFPEKEKIIGEEHNSLSEDKVNNTFLLENGFNYEDKTYYKSVSDLYYINIMNGKIRVRIEDSKNEITEYITAIIGNDKIIYEKYKNNEIVESKNIVSSQKKDCNKEKCKDLNDYIDYVYYLKSMLENNEDK